MKTFTCSYTYRCRRYVFHLDADDWQDAHDRIARLMWAQVDGELIAEVPLGDIGWLRRLWRWLVA